MSAYSTIWAYLWDLEDEGIDEAVRHCREEIGLDAISVATAYHTFQQLRPQRPGKKLMQVDRSAIYFQPDPALYADTCIEPYVAPLARENNPLASLARSCQRSGLDLISWTVCLHSSHLAQSYPHCAQQTAYGDNLGWILCPGVDDVRAYAIALCRDLAANYGVKRLELETCNFGAYGHAHYHVKDGTPLGSIGRYLYSLSFSEGCMRRAGERGIDAQGLRQWVREKLDPVFATGEPLEGDLEAFVGEHPQLRAFQQLREELVASLVGEIRRASGVEVSFLLMGDRWGAGIHRDRILEVADRVEILAYSSDPQRVGERVAEELAHLDDAGRLVVGLLAYPPGATSAEGLQAVVASACARGAQQFSYYNYGIAPRPCLGWIGECITYCRKYNSTRGEMG